MSDIVESVLEGYQPKNHSNFSEKYDDYIIDKSKVESYIKKKKIASFFDSVFGLTTLFFLFFLMAGGVLLISQIVELATSRLPVDTVVFIENQGIESIIGVIAILIVLFIIMMLLVEAESKFDRGAESTGVTKNKWSLHYLARATHAGKQENTDTEEFERLINTLLNHGVEFSDGFKQGINKYIDTIKEDEEYFQESVGWFSDLIAERIQRKPDRDVILLQYLSNPDFPTETEKAAIEKEASESVSYIDAIIEELPTLGFKNVGIKFWGTYLIVAVIGVLSIELVNQRIGTGILLVLLTGLQIFHQKDNDE